MQTASRSHIIMASTLLVLLVAPACFAADLMCYVCSDCAKVDKSTPLLACNEDFFNHGGSTEASTVTTTESTTTATTEETTSSPTTTEMTNTAESSEGSTPTTPTTTTPTTSAETTTTEMTTEETTTTPELTESTEPAMPTPATVGPPQTTTGVPTPPNEDLLREVTRLQPVEITASSEFPVRQRRATIDTSVTYHCYTVQKSVNNTMQTERGCSRVTDVQSVCDELKVQYNEVQLKNCDPCSMNACNSASSLLKSTLLTTLLLAMVAAALRL